jgi:MraZ protein
VAAARFAVFRKVPQVRGKTRPPDVGKSIRSAALAGMFIGEHTFKVDGKGRVSIPADFRRELEEGDPLASQSGRPRMVIVYGHDAQKQLQVYTYNDYRALAAEISALPRGSDRRKIMQSLILNKARPTEVDSDGRLVLPQALRDKIGLEGTAYFGGMGETFEIWKPEVFETQNASVTSKLIEEQGEGFDPLSLLSEMEG